MVGGDVGVWAARDVVLHQPLGLQWAQQAQYAHVGLGKEDVVNHTLREREERLRTGLSTAPLQDSSCYLTCYSSSDNLLTINLCMCVCGPGSI